MNKLLHVLYKVALVCVLGSQSALLLAQDDSDQESVAIEEVVVIGTQIRGAKIEGLLPVNVISSEDIGNLGINSGDQLLEAIPEIGQNFFNEAENISGGINSVRGDIGAFNLRSIGTGNTLVLINGRRMVSSPGFQTEVVGGSAVPVSTANSNALPVYGIERVEVLRDGASALYGADAVAGVINTVLKNDFEGLNIRFKHVGYSNFDRNNLSLNLEFGSDFANGRGNIGVFADYYNRDRINSQDDPDRWGQSDARHRIPEGSPWENDTAFRRDSINSQYGQFDVVNSVGTVEEEDGTTHTHSLVANMLVDSAGEFVVYPNSNDRCDEGDTFAINSNTCGIQDKGASNLRYNPNLNSDLRSDLTRINLFSYLTYDLGDMEFFGEIGYYSYDTNTTRWPSAPFSAVKLTIPKDSYYNPFGSGPNRLDATVLGDDVPADGLDVLIDNYRFVEAPRIVDNSGTTYRFLAGLRGQFNDWDWEGAILSSRASREDVTHNRISNTLITNLLARTTEDAYNPFHGLTNPTVADTGLAPALIDVYRNGTSTLNLFDFKITNPSVATLPGGDIALLIGFEARTESFVDDRDPRLDGTIEFEQYTGSNPYVSDVVNSSPTPDSEGSRTVVSLFTEAILPVTDDLTVQVALRSETFSDVDDPIVGKIAVGYRLHPNFSLRSSVQQSYRAPNLVTLNEGAKGVQTTGNDAVCEYVNADDVDGDEILDCSHSIQRTTQGNANLVSEESTNSSFGLVFSNENATVTVDYWSIEKKNSIGLFGDTNHTILELLNLIEAGNSSCGTSGNSRVIREDVTTDTDELALFEAKNICPTGQFTRIEDDYLNLDNRNLSGLDVSVYIDFPVSWGTIKYKLNYARLLEFKQIASGSAARINAAVADGTLPAGYNPTGFGDLIGQNGNQEERLQMSVSTKIKKDYGVALTWSRVGSYYQNHSTLILADGSTYPIPEVDIFNFNFSYKTDIAGNDIRFRIGINNITDQRAPLARGYFAYDADSHSDYGRYYYVAVKYSFF